MIALLTLGFLIGMRHALEADHVAAVAALATRCPTVADTARQGVAWGLGHTITLFLFGAVVLMLDVMLPHTLAGYLELAVGIMLLILGADVLWRAVRRSHLPGGPDLAVAGAVTPGRGIGSGGAGGERAGAVAATVTADGSTTLRRFPLRALLVGLMHGMAGSAALILVALNTIPSPVTGLAYIAVFGIGSIAGMLALSALIAVPMTRATSGPSGLYFSLQAVVGLATLGLGFHTLWTVGAGL